MIYINYRERIKGAREDRDMSQSDIARILHKSQQVYNHIEKGRAELKIDDLVVLCRVFNLSADYLIGLINDPVSYKRYYFSFFERDIVSVQK